MDAIMHVMDLGLGDKACVVTGASRGIGRAIARRLAAEGASVLLVARSADMLEDARAEAGDSAEALALDITGPAAAERIVQESESRLGGLDVLVNNAGTTEAKPLDQLDDEDWQRLWELHVMAPLRLMQAAAPRMIESGGGRIVNICSSSGKRPSLTNAAYSVTKAAQLSLSRVFADAHAAHNVLVNAVTPGPVSTGLWMDDGGLADQVASLRGISREEAIQRQQARVPLGRFGTEDEIAGIVVVLSSALASNVTGAAWSVDGGTVPVII